MILNLAGDWKMRAEYQTVTSAQAQRVLDYSDAPEAPVRIVGKHLSGLRDALRRHICGKAA